MNIYQHLFFIIPIVLLLLWGYIGNQKVNPNNDMYITVIISTVLGLAGGVMYIGRFVIPFFINFYSMLGQY